MHKASAALAIWLFCVLAVAAAQPVGSTAFLNVNVVPMRTERVLWNHTVVVRDGIITALGPAAATTVPVDAARIEGHGSHYLVPGLADMHTHVLEAGDLLPYVANGVTSVLSMGLTPDAFVADANAAIERGDVIGPRIYFSLMVDGANPVFEDARSVASAEDARRAVRFAAESGYDFIKVYNRLGASELATVLAEARLAELAVIGHAVRAVDLLDALSRGQVLVAHAEEFFYSVFDNQADVSRIPSVVAATRDAGAYVVATLSTLEILAEQWGRPEVLSRYMNDPRARELTATMQRSWPERDYIRRRGSIDELLEFSRVLVKALHDGGVPLMTGTDSPVIPGAYPGYSLHHEIETLLDLGLSEYRALAAATRIPGEFVEKYVPSATPFGVIDVGMKADLLVVAENPLRRIATLRAPLGVMTAGRWHTAKQLADAMAEQRARFAARARNTAPATGSSP